MLMECKKSCKGCDPTQGKPSAAGKVIDVPVKTE
jgi:hypothetical protein